MKKLYVVNMFLCVLMTTCGSSSVKLNEDQITSMLSVLFKPTVNVANEYWEMGETTGEKTVSISNSCPGGGNYSLSKSVTVTTVNSGQFQANYALEQSFSDCKPTVGNDYNLNGSIESNGNVNFTSSNFFSTSSLAGSSDVTVSGTVDISGQDVESPGSCDLDVQIDSSHSGTNATLTIDYSICGNSDSSSYSLILF
ncbi:MAG: hypothetical protein KDD52_08135 [Bdellovibrionales bacterium]|nr:hypothetical protein [Bdellovibrionales bacterium]